MADPIEGGNTVLLHKHVFGLKVDVKGHVQFVDENIVLYPCGNNVVVYNTETRQQTLIAGACSKPLEKEMEPSSGITALAIAPNRKLFGMAERGGVSLFEAQTLRRRRTLMSTESIKHEILSIAFSGDSKMVLTVENTPESCLSLWTTDRAAKIVASLKFLQPGVEGSLSSVFVHQADFCPSDSSIVCVSGNRLLKLLKVSEGSFKPMPLVFKRELQNFTCHCWVGDALVVGTDNGELLYIRNYEFTALLASANGEAVHSLCSFSKGFICGARGSLRVFEAADDGRENFKCNKIYTVEGNQSPIIELAVSPSEESLVCTTLNRQMYTFSLGSMGSPRTSEAPLFEYLTCEVHGPGPGMSAAINALDVCVWKPLVVTCGRDHTVRVWNYRDQTVILTKNFPDEPLSVALHPSGLIAVVGFADHLRVLSILMDDMRTIKEIPVRGCRLCAFSHGGQAFAVATSSLVQIYDTYTGAMKLQLRGHQQAVRSVAWSDRDRRLLTVGKDGNLFLWDARTGARLKESLQPRTCFDVTALAGDAAAPASRVFAHATDMTIKAFASATLTPENQISCPVEVSCMVAASNGRALFVGTNAPQQPGTVVALVMKEARFPGMSAAQATAAAVAAAEGGDQGKALDKGTFPAAMAASAMEPQAFVAHGAGVTCMCLSTDGCTLFTGGEDGSLSLFEVREVDARGTVRLQGKESGAADFAEEILVTQGDLLAKKAEFDSLAQKVEGLKLSNDQNLRSREMKFKERIQDVTGRFQAELDEGRARYDALATDKAEAEGSYEERLRGLRDANTAELAQRKEQYRVKIANEKRRKDMLYEERQKQTAEWDAETSQLVAAQANELGNVESDYEAKIAAEQAAQTALHRDKEGQVFVADRWRKLLEEDADREVSGVKVTFEQRLVLEQETTTALKGEHAVMKKKYQVLQKEAKDLEEGIKGRGMLEKQLRDVVKGLEKDIVGHRKEIKERDETIAEKEKQMYDLKKKNQELEKFKFVLDYKIKELKRQIEPRENEIADMRTQVEEMDQELEQYHKSNAALDLMISELRLKIDGVQREVATQQAAHRATQSVLSRFRRDLEGCAAHLTEYKKLKASVRELYVRHVQEQSGCEAEPEAVALDPQAEYNRERENLERNVEGLKKKIFKDLEMFNADHARLAREGVNLTEEMNLLRRESKLLRRQQKGMDMETNAIMGLGPVVAASFHTASPALRREIEMQEAQLLALENRTRELRQLVGSDF